MLCTVPRLAQQYTNRPPAVKSGFSLHVYTLERDILLLVLMPMVGELERNVEVSDAGIKLTGRV